MASKKIVTADELMKEPEMPPQPGQGNVDLNAKMIKDEGKAIDNDNWIKLENVVKELQNYEKNKQLNDVRIKSEDSNDLKRFTIEIRPKPMTLKAKDAGQLDGGNGGGSGAQTPAPQMEAPIEQVANKKKFKIALASKETVKSLLSVYPNDFLKNMNIIN